MRQSSTESHRTLRKPRDERRRRSTGERVRLPRFLASAESDAVRELANCPSCPFRGEDRITGGSHVIFSAPGVREIVSVPAKRPIKPVYIRQFLAPIENAVEVKRDEQKNKPMS